MRRLPWIAVPAALAALAAPALAAVDFGPPELVESEHGIAEFRYYGEQVGVDAAGNAFIGMKRSLPNGDDVDEQAMVLRRCTGGGWMQSVVAGSADYLTHAHDLAVSAGGAAILVWTDERNSTLHDLYSAYRPAGGTWSVQPIVSGQISEVDADIDDAGNAAVVWASGSISRKVFASYRPAGGTWEAAQELAALHTGVLAMSGAGEVAVVGQNGLSGTGALRAFIRPAGQGWPASSEAVPTPLPGPGSNDGPNALEYDGAGRLIVFDREFNDIEATVRSGGAWGPTQTLHDNLFPSGSVFDIARHPQGAVAAWREGDDLWVARLVGGAWDAPKKFAGGGSQYSTASVGADAAGKIVVAATRITPNGHEVWGSTTDGIATAWPAETAQLSPQAVPGGRYYRDPAVGGGKYLVIAWTTRNGSDIDSHAIASGAAPDCAGAPPPPPPDPIPTAAPITAVATPIPTPQPKPRARPALASFVKLPSCARARKLKVTLKVPSGQDVKSIELRVNGKRASLRRAPKVAGSVTLRKLPKRFKLAVTVTFRSGAPLKATRTVKSCG